MKAQSIGSAISSDAAHGRQPTSVDRTFLGMTLAEYAAARQVHPQACRTEYSAMMRLGVGVAPAAITRREQHADVTKFCLATGPHALAPLETESVIVPMHSYRGMSWYTLCVSSQVGCRMGCTFCETARMGLLRNLTACEIVSQRLAARQLMLADGTPTPPHFRYFGDGIQNIVFMGMGEPLDNFDNVVQAIRVLNEPQGLNVPLSQITVSTVGRVDGIRRLAALARERERDWWNLRLAISLNAPEDRLRSALMPMNKSTPLADLQRALLEYPLARKGRYLVEYVLIKDINDSLQQADQVAAWCRPLPCIVNLIPYNPQRHTSYETPGDAVVLRFMRRLKAQGIFVKRRVTRGRDLMGACGQLGNPDKRGSGTRPAPPLRSPQATPPQLGAEITAHSSAFGKTY